MEGKDVLNKLRFEKIYFFFCFKAFEANPKQVRQMWTLFGMLEDEI